MSSASPVGQLVAVGGSSDDAVAAAERAALAGELVTAARGADAVLDDDGARPGARARAARVLAAVLTHRGLLAHASDLHDWAATLDRHRGGGPPPRPAPSAILAAAGCGRLGAHDGATDSPTSDGTGAVTGPPTPGRGGAALLARGVRASVRRGGSATALSDLTRAVAVLECSGTPALHDESPVVPGVLVALHRGEPDLARALLDRAVAADLAGPAFRRRHLLWGAWAAMTAGDPSAARAAEVAAAALPGPVEVRDELLAVGLAAALARRVGDTRALLAWWPRARRVVVRHEVDLWSLLPFAEIRVAAARVGATGWLAPHLHGADPLLDALGAPPLWSAPWHWSGVLAGIDADDPHTARRHAARLRAAGPEDAVAVVCGEAARVWLDVLAGTVDAATVTAAAEALAGVGQPWDGARLAREAAMRTTDRRAVATLLGVGRALLPPPPSATPSGDAPVAPPAVRAVRAVGAVPAPGAAAPTVGASASPPAASPTAGAPLSEREREVAALLLDGMTYAEVGERLFIATKTVEHHVGRMRRRLGSQTRAGLFADLRRALEQPPTDQRPSDQRPTISPT